MAYVSGAAAACGLPLIGAARRSSGERRGKAGARVAAVAAAQERRRGRAVGAAASLVHRVRSGGEGVAAARPAEPADVAGVAVRR